MQAWHKKEKAKQIKKGKSEKQKQRTEKLARRNPDRIQKQIDDLKALEETGRMSPADKKFLMDLQRDLVAVKKAKEALGEKVPEKEKRAPPAAGGGVKRSAGEMTATNEKRPPRYRQQVEAEAEAYQSDSGESTSSSVREIPMPSGTPPPLPRAPYGLPGKPVLVPVLEPARTTYAAAPVLRDFRKEAAVFVPAAVKRRLEFERTRDGSGGDVDAEGEGEGEVEGGEEREGEGVRKRINAAPDVDVRGEVAKFRAEMEEAEDEEA